MKILKYLSLLLLLVGFELQAQYNPDNPPEPTPGLSYTLSARVSPVGAGSVSPATQKVKAGLSATVSASPNTDYTFVGWEDEEGNAVSTDRSYKIVMPEKNVVLTAVFRYSPGSPGEPVTPELYRYAVLTTKAEPSVGGSVTSGGRYVVGSTVNVYASPNSDYVFDGWNLNGEKLDISSSTYRHTIVDGDNILTAHFRYNPGSPNEPTTPQVKYPLTIECSPEDGGSVSPNSGTKYAAGTTVSLYASLSSGYVFEGWVSEDGTVLSTSRSFNVTMPASPLKLTAKFRYSPDNPGEPTSPAPKRNIIYGGREVALPGSSTIFNVSLENVDQIKGINIDVTFPEGPVFDIANATPAGRAGLHTLAVEPVEGSTDTWRFQLRGEEAFPGGNGSLIKIPVKFPEDVEAGTEYVVTFSHGVIYRVNGTQDAVDVSDGRIKISPLPEALPASADFIVGEVEADRAEVMPGDPVTLRWKVSNNGSLDAEGGWSESMFITNSSGRRVMIGSSYYDGEGLKSGESVARTATATIPRIPGMSGPLNVGVTVLPYLASDELVQMQANNTTVGSGNPITLGKQLILTIPESVTEGKDANIRGQLTRTGDWSESETFTISLNREDSRLKVPATVIIPRDQSAAWFQLTLSGNDKADPSTTVKISAEGNGYDAVESTMTIRDSVLPAITLTFDPDEATEGEIVTLTASIPFPVEDELSINLSSALANRMDIPDSVKISAGETEGSVMLTVIDNSTVDGHQEVPVIASAPGFDEGAAYLSVIDNDMPALEMQLTPTEVSENAGPMAVRGIITRTTNIDKKVTLWLTSEHNDRIIFPLDRLTMDPGVSSVEFSVGVKDNDIVDGDRDVDITAAVYVSSCSCTAAGDNAGSVTGSIRIIDNDGPSLTLISTRSVVAEGDDSGITVTLKRNADLEKALEVTLSCDTSGALELPSKVIIPQGKDQTTFKVTAPLNETSDDDRTVVISANADGFAASSLWLMVSDRTLPDARISSISVSSEEATAGSKVDVTLTLANTGLLPLPAQTEVALYLDNTLSGRLWLQEPLPAGESKEFTKTLNLPNRTGVFKIYAVANPNSEFKEMNHGDNNSERLTITLLSPFKAGVDVDKTILKKGESVTVSGHLDNPTDEGQEVEVYILNHGSRSTVLTNAMADGSFEVGFTPYEGQTGHFSVGACYPGEGLKEEMSSFDIPDLRLVSSDYITCQAIAGEPFNLSIGVNNPCAIPMTSVKAVVKGVPEGCEYTLKAFEVLEGAGNSEINLILTGNKVTEGNDWEKFRIDLKSAEGAELSIPIYWYCRSAVGSLQSGLSSIVADLPVGKTIEYPVSISNVGSGESGRIDVVLPEWMKCAGPTRLASLSPGASTTVTLLLKPADTMDLNHKVSGQIAVNCDNGKGFTIPYDIMPVSEESAEVEVSACDEYTYNTTEAPKVAGALVKMVNPGNGMVVAEGYTDETGVFKYELPAGYYRIEVSADKHESWFSTMFLNPGKVNKVTANISFNPITISYTVVPTEVEDEYLIETTARYELNVPAPVVNLIAPKRIDGDNMEIGEATIINIQMVNEGLMTAFNVSPVFEKENPEWSFELLEHKEPFDLAPHQVVNIPVRVTRIDDLIRRMKSPGKNAAEDMYRSFNGCMTHISKTYEVICGDTIWKNEGAASMAMKLCATAATMAGIYSAVSDLIGYGGAGVGAIGPASPVNNSGPKNTATTTKQPVGGEQSFSICDPCDAQKADTILDQLVSTAGGPIGIFWQQVSTAVKMYLSQGKKIKVLTERVRDDVTGAAADMAAENGGNILGWIVTIVEVSEPCEENASQQKRINRLTASDGAESDSSEPYEKPFFRHTWQEVFYNETRDFIEGWDTIMEIYSILLGDPIWMTDPTEDKLDFMDYVSTIEPLTRISDEDLARIKPESVSFKQARDYLDRWVGLVDVEKDYGDHLGVLADKVGEIEEAAESAGFKNGADRFLNAYASYQSEFDRMKNNSVCASVALRFSQTMTMTREAFRGTLEVFNGHDDTPMRDVKLNLTVTDPDGKLAGTHEFQMNPERLTGFEGELDLSAGWELKAGARGVADVLFIPTRYAAPEIPVVWTFGGNITYIDPFTSLEVTRKLQPVSLTVNPAPTLDMTYFLQRDVYSDDPLTPEVIESQEDAEFALVIHNVGAGQAENVKLITRQPQIVDNEKGILLDTSFVSSQLNGEDKHLSLGSSMASDFGNIPAGSAVYAQWWFNSSIVGHFTEYDVEATHVSSFDNPDLSLLGEVNIHELIRGITDPSAEDGRRRRLFLTNDIADSEDAPDMVYFSDGSEEMTLGIADLNFEMTDKDTYEVKVFPRSPGWVYGNIGDPAGGRMRISRIVRLSDGAELPADNVWLTRMTLRDGNSPVHENRLHIAVNTDAPETYRIIFESRPSTELEVELIGGIPSEEAWPAESVKIVTVSFTKDVSEDGFTRDALRLTRGGEHVDLTDVVITRSTPSLYSIALGETTLYEGYYVLTVDASTILDAEGFYGIDGKSKGWLQTGDSLLGIDRPGEEACRVTLSPVPIRDSMTVTGEFSGIERLTIHDSAGRLVARWDNLKADDNKVTVAVEGISTDFMIVTIVTDEGKVISKRALFITK